MRWFSRIRTGVNPILKRRQAEQDLDAELQDHMEQEIADGIRRGLPAEEAKFAAQRLVGSISLYKEECRDARNFGLIEDVVRDVRYAVRSLRRAPLFTAVAIGTLALGIGANTIIFTFVEDVVLRPLPVSDPGALTTLNWGDISNFSFPNYLDFRDRNTAFSSMAAYRFNAASISVHTRDSFRAWGYQATGSYFQMLGVRPLLGRFFGPADDRRASPNAVLVISHRLWQGRFGGDPNILGKSVKVDGFPFTVIGVAPESFTGTELIVAGDYWLPLGMQPRIEPENDFVRWRTSQNLWIIGRLRAGVSRAQATTNLEQIAAQLEREYPNDMAGHQRLSLSRPGLVGEALRGPVTKISIVLMAIGGVGLLLACINLAAMLLARASDRYREIGIRLALGASRTQVIRQLFVENFLLAAAGGMGGLAISVAVTRFLTSWHPAFDIPIGADLHLDSTVLCFVLAVTVSTTLLFGFAPTLQAVRINLIPSLKNESILKRFGRWSARDVLVGVQVALSVILVISSSLVIRSLRHALTMDLGFDPGNAVSVSFDLSLQGYNSEKSRHFDATLLQNASHIPGISSVAVANSLPLRTGGNDSEYVSRTDRPLPGTSERHLAMVYNISPGYFRTLGTRLLSGRDFNGADRQQNLPVAVVNEALVHSLFGNENAIGKHVRLSLNAGDPGFEIVGVAATAKYRSLNEDPMPAIFLPIAQTGTAWTTLIARSRLPAAEAADLLRKSVLDLDPELTVFNAGSLKEQLALPFFPARALATVLSIFGALAMVLAATGLFALVAYAVARRTREIGIRIALGARPSQVLGAVLGPTLALSSAGILIGTAITLAAGHLLSSVLYGVSPRDPATYLAALSVFVLVALLACWNPAARALRIDPAYTLRQE
ncbi:MAG TPA: ABC transporter permease [Bryobacteraceae bacterium]|jgi:predicted permease|nr:ABC transporter permease [Bryobacteraceae bacterium]